jgi:hypothetical protein
MGYSSLGESFLRPGSSSLFLSTRSKKASLNPVHTLQSAYVTPTARQTHHNVLKVPSTVRERGGKHRGRNRDT